HVLLSQDYAVFFLAVVMGVLFDLVFSVHLLNGIVYEYIGLLFIFFGTAIIYWAQSTTRKMGKKVSDNRDISFFLHGPYRYTRNPTNFGLTLAIVGLGLLIHSFFSIVWVIITYLISKFFFIKRQDEILKERYGDVFLEYKKKVKDWI
ncbi:isoprenylcysteine carboxylmethyltransferase family protein, partial [Candidatus Nomurabacteria bacterium]|nr:isoprenylcysteine carboxylmethyltransferase family protein [Candidatus Nomurabacteria bacterium]